MSSPLHILCLENDLADAELLHDTLETEGIACTLTRVEAECDFRAALQQGGGFDLILADYTLPSFDGLSALKIVRQQLPDVPFIFVSGTLGEEVAIEALKMGATDYVFKTRLSRLVPAVQRAMREAEERAERKRAEEAARRSEKELRDAIEFIPAMVFIALPGPSSAFVSRPWREYTGLSVQDTSGSGWQTAIHPEDLERHVKKWQVSSATGEPFEDEARFRRAADGEYRWFLVRAVPLHDDLGNILKWYGVLADIEDRKRAEALLAGEKERLQRSEAYLAEAQRLAHTGSWAWNPLIEECFYWSEEMFRIYALDSQQGLPTPETFWQRIHPEDRDSMRELLGSSALEKAEYEHDHRIVMPDGSVKHIHAIGTPVLDQAGQLVEYVGTAMDVTERKRAEETLRESETRFRTFVDHAGDALFVYDLEQKTVVDVNREACESLGYTRQELIGKTPFAWHVDSYQAEMESVAERAAAGETVFDTHWHRRKDGTVFPVEVHTSLVAYAGRRFLLKVARDISDRLRAEEQRERLRQLEAELAHMDRVSILGELTASIAHEVNQPLSGIVSSGGACLRWLAADPPNLEEVREAVRRIVGAGKHAGEVIARIRALTKRTAAPKEKLDLNETIRQVLVLVGGEAKKNKVIIRTLFADGLSPVLGDRVQFQQVVLNLVINGIEAMSDVSERTRELVITTRNIDAEQVQVTVEDSGIGINPNTIEKIFDPFYTTKSTGMGMGLSISRSILQHHGGRLWATAKDGAGASFHFTVPKYQQEESNAGV